MEVTAYSEDECSECKHDECTNHILAGALQLHRTGTTGQRGKSPGNPRWTTERQSQGSFLGHARCLYLKADGRGGHAESTQRPSQEAAAFDHVIRPLGRKSHVRDHGCSEGGGHLNNSGRPQTVLPTMSLQSRMTWPACSRGSTCSDFMAMAVSWAAGASRSGPGACTVTSACIRRLHHVWTWARRVTRAATQSQARPTRSSS